MLAARVILSEYGPQLGRPFADTVDDSDFPNMKELRVQHQGKPIRTFFAFDPSRRGGNDSNLLIVFYVQIMPDDFVMQLHRF